MAELTVMTWNVQNLFRPAAGDADAAARYDQKLDALAGVIDAVSPDVVALQEVGGAEEVADLATRCAADFDHQLTGLPDRRGIRVALMSTRRLSHRTDVEVLPGGVLPVQTADPDVTSDRVGRGILAASVRAGGETVWIVACHLKSKLLSFPGGPGGATRFSPRDEGERLRYAGYALFRRAAEAMTCRALLDTLLTAPGDAPGEGRGRGTELPVVFVGDLNDEPQAATTQILSGPGGSQIDFRGGSGFQRPDSSDGYRMWNLDRLLPPDGQNHSRVYRGHGELIDHILASQTLVNPHNLPKVGVVAATPLPSIEDVPEAAPDVPSDHAAVVATFSI
jgi:endonuclease/exonuclease/phosphatase family metal-dependent hydrolase